jgi:hypothetical protein
MNINGKQLISILMAVLGVITISGAQLTPLLGATLASTVISVAALVNTILAAVMSNLTSQSNQVKDVAAMPGIERVSVNAQANTTIAALATDPAQPKIGPIPGAKDAVTETAAKG